MNELLRHATLLTFILLGTLAASAQRPGKSDVIVAKPVLIDPTLYQATMYDTSRKAKLQLVELAKYQPQIYTVLGDGNVRAADDEEEAPEAEGPNILPIDLNFATAGAGGVASEVVNINKSIYADKNTAVGHHYYYPREYELGYSPEDGKVDLNVTYGVTEENQAGRIIVTATLRPKIRTRDLAVVANQLDAQYRTTGSPRRVATLQALPLEELPRVNFDQLTLFNVGVENTILEAPSDLEGDIKIIFITERIEEFMEILMSKEGLSGKVFLKPRGLDEISVPFYIRVNSAETFGHLDLKGTPWRTDWANPLAYPIKLGYLHALRYDGPSKGYRVYSYKADGAVIPPGRAVNFDHLRVPARADNDDAVERIWLDYSIVDCEDCDDAMKDKIMGSVEQYAVAAPEQIELDVFTPITESIGRLRVGLRSTQTTPSGDEMRELAEVTISENNVVLPAGKLYGKNGAVSYEYQLRAYTPAGVAYLSDWIASDAKTLVIGAHQMDQHLPEFPRE